MKFTNNHEGQFDFGPFGNKLLPHANPALKAEHVAYLASVIVRLAETFRAIARPITRTLE
jgi:hypothetical protein